MYKMYFESLYSFFLIYCTANIIFIFFLTFMKSAAGMKLKDIFFSFDIWSLYKYVHPIVMFVHHLLETDESHLL